MSFAIWRTRPPFQFAPGDKEQIYQIGNVFVVTDDPARATQIAVDAVLNAPQPKPSLTADALASVLIDKGQLTSADIAAAKLIP